MNRQPQGQQKLEKIIHMGEVLVASTSPVGKETIANEISSLKEAFDSLYEEISGQKKELESLLLEMRGYKDEYERISDWLQQMDADMKAAKTMLLANLPEKEKQYLKVKVNTNRAFFCSGRFCINAMIVLSVPETTGRLAIKGR
jgi:nesprin-1